MGQLAIELEPGPGSCTVVTIRGELDAAGAPTLQERLEPVLSGGPPHLRLDLRPTEFIDSTGLGALLGVARRVRDADGELVLVGPLPPPVQRLFDLTGVAELFEVVDEPPVP